MLAVVPQHYFNIDFFLTCFHCLKVKEKESVIPSAGLLPKGLQQLGIDQIATWSPGLNPCLPFAWQGP